MLNDLDVSETVGFETNLKINSDRKLKKYLPLISDQENNFDKVKFVNVSISSLGVFGQSANKFIDMLKDLKFDEQHIRYVKKKIISTCIRASYYIFCQRNKDWTSPELLKIWVVKCNKKKHDYNYFFY